MTSRQPSNRGGMPAGGAMGNFAQVGGRTLPSGTTSAQRFEQSTQGGRPAGPSMSNPLAHLVNNNNRAGSFPMGQARNFQPGSQGPNSPRAGSSRGRGSRRGDNKGGRGEEQLAKVMPLTANLDASALKLERSQTGWKPHNSMAAPQPGAGHMAPDMVQRKVKAALNKMTPQNFDKISDQILGMFYILLP